MCRAFMALKRFCLSNTGLLLVLAVSSGLLLIITAAQPGFISIDCGGSEQFVSATNLTWVTDEGYITTGKTATVQDAANLSTVRQTVRYFPEKIPKNCYELSPVQEGSGYIVRTYFHYGNFDNKETMPEFSLIVDGTVMVDFVGDGSYEMYVPAKSDTISVCLARAVSSSITGDPFITSLELRPLPLGTTYDLVAFQQGFGLYGIYSVDLGSNSSSTLRYPNDTLDRLWLPYAAPDNSNIATTHEIVLSKERNLDFPPLVMLQTATTGPNLPYDLKGLSSQSKYLVTMHFSELNPNVTGPGQRVFNIYSNVWQQGSQPWAPNIDIYNLSGGQFMGVELYSTQPVTPVNGSILISFQKYPNSTYGPIISGIQVLLLTDEPLSNLTSSDDARTISDISDYYGINGSFGDPCMPAKFSWTWISCNLLDSIPRITSIVLSRWSLKGVIYSQFDKLIALTDIYLDGNNLTGMIPEFNSLSDLEVLDLSKNRLTGPIPEFSSSTKLQTLNLENNKLTGTIPATLSTLSSLKELFLANNQLEGEVPPSLLAKVKAGTLNFTYGGNSKLTCNGELCDAPASPPSPSNRTPPPPVIELPPSCATTKMVSTLLIYLALILLFRVMAW